MAVRNGLSMQLAFYSWLLSPEAFDVDSKYYLFPRQTFVPNRQNNKEAYDLVVEFYRHRIEDLHKGRVDIGGAFGSSEVFPAITDQELSELEALDGDEYNQRELEVMVHRLPMAYAPECDYCTCKALCGLAKPIEKTEEV